MTTEDPQAVRRDLLLEQAVLAQLDPLIHQATQRVLLLEQSPRMEVNQLQNLVAVAIETRSREAVINFIRYQIARSPQNWGTAQDSFGHAVIADLRELVAQRTDAALAWAADQLKQRTDPESSDDPAPPVDLTPHRERIYIRLMQLYLGYLNRTFYSAKRVKSFAMLREVSRAD